MLNSLSKSGRRLLALLILFLLLSAIVMLTVMPLWRAMVSYDERIADLRFRLQKFDEMVEMEVPLNAQLDMLTSQQESAVGLLKGESHAIAGANLQALFKQLVLNAGGRLESTQILPGASSEVMDRVGIKAQFSADIGALQKVLYQIEFGNPVLFVDKIEVHTRQIQRFRRNITETENGQLLSISLEVSGYRRNEDAG